MPRCIGSVLQQVIKMLQNKLGRSNVWKKTGVEYSACAAGIRIRFKSHLLKVLPSQLLSKKATSGAFEFKYRVNFLAASPRFTISPTTCQHAESAATSGVTHSHSHGPLGALSRRGGGPSEHMGSLRPCYRWLRQPDGHEGGL